MLVRTKNKSIQRKPQQYHGRTIIELHNHKSGSRERVESDNEFTTGINDFLRDGGYFNNSPFTNATWRGRAMYRNLIGGILLFDSEIEKVNGAYPTIMPAGVKMTANGSYGVTNNANPTEMGSFNSNESSFNASALTFVYDWSTSHNCDIACVSLTSDVGGYLGYGNSVSQTAHSTLKDIFENQSSIAKNNSGGSGAVGIEAVGENLYQLSIQQLASGTRDFTIFSKEALINSVNLFGFPRNSKTVTIPNTVLPSYTGYIYLGMVNGKVVAMPQSLASGATYVIGVYDIATDAWSTLTFTAPMAISAMYFGVNWIGGDGYIYVWNGTNYNQTGFIIDMSDGTTEQVTRGNGYWYMGEGLALSYNNNRDYESPLFIIDEVNNTRYPINGNISENRRTLHMDFGDGQIRLSQAGSGESSNLYVYRNPLYLATVNNLGETITKTSSDTMKVTYIVTPA